MQELSTAELTAISGGSIIDQIGYAIGYVLGLFVRSLF
ncbi:bacteriocin [Aureibacter tunicatorum]|uniref:Bacteriocin-like protein n=1 Tax=Aureibacter tunicatorum TaxID=866807 RepID=A0AAE3XSI1_9BACT|nr:bacteriocin [Aureibacter tunicatorum]MDR6240739.1 bacteriocin-like protein [Aureibacter tunicatorum]BDD06928.1 hypothetical protein AUTU_44110 [Aureibacter tunicatorum]